MKSLILAFGNIHNKADWQMILIVQQNRFLNSLIVKMNC